MKEPKRPLENQKPIVVSKLGSVQGFLYRIDSKEGAHKVWLEDANGNSLHCDARPEIAQRLSKLMFKPVRVRGRGCWERSVEGKWRLRKLDIENVMELDATKASIMLGKMRLLGGLKWAGIADPHGEVAELRS